MITISFKYDGATLLIMTYPMLPPIETRLILDDNTYEITGYEICPPKHTGQYHATAHLVRIAKSITL